MNTSLSYYSNMFYNGYCKIVYGNSICVYDELIVLVPYMVCRFFDAIQINKICVFTVYLTVKFVKYDIKMFHILHEQLLHLNIFNYYVW